MVDIAPQLRGTPAAAQAPDHPVCLLQRVDHRLLGHDALRPVLDGGDGQVHAAPDVGGDRNEVGLDLLQHRHRVGVDALGAVPLGERIESAHVPVGGGHQLDVGPVGHGLGVASRPSRPEVGPRAAGTCGGRPDLGSVCHPTAGLNLGWSSAGPGRAARSYSIPIHPSPITAPRYLATAHLLIFLSRHFRVHAVIGTSWGRCGKPVILRRRESIPGRCPTHNASTPHPSPTRHLWIPAQGRNDG